LSSCGEPGVLRVVLLTQESANPITENSKYEQMVREAVGLLGYNTRFVTRSRGAVKIELIPVEGLHFTGRELTDEESRCFRSGWAVPFAAENVAHEIGHMLGLEHVSDENNLMSPNGERRGAQIFFNQMDTIDFNIDELGGC